MGGAVTTLVEVIKMIVESCTFAVHFPKNVDIQNLQSALEEKLGDFRKPFVGVPVPVDAPAELPRMVAYTEHMHSQLVFTGRSVQMVTEFDDNYNKDISKCVGYVRNKCNDIIDSLRVVNPEVDGKPQFYFSGLTTSVLLGAEDGIDDAIKYISEKFLKCRSKLSVDESSISLAWVVDDEYYINIMAGNSRDFDGEPDERGSFAESGEYRDLLQVVVDINDRYAFNHKSGYLSSAEAVGRVVDLAEKFMQEEIEKFVRTGEMQYVGQ